MGGGGGGGGMRYGEVGHRGGTGAHAPNLTHRVSMARHSGPPPPLPCVRSSPPPQCGVGWPAACGQALPSASAGPSGEGAVEMESYQ